MGKRWIQKCEKNLIRKKYLEKQSLSVNTGVTIGWVLIIK